MQALMAAVPQGGDAGAGPQGGGNAKSDDVVDAEFTEVKGDEKQ